MVRTDAKYILSYAIGLAGNEKIAGRMLEGIPDIHDALNAFCKLDVALQINYLRTACDDAEEGIPT